jgi:Fe-S-cluster containining protein
MLSKAARVPLNEKGVCVHLTPDMTCAVYDKRPYECRVDAQRPVTIGRDTWFAMNRMACNSLAERAGAPPPFPPESELEEGDEVPCCQRCGEPWDTAKNRCPNCGGYWYPSD